MERKKKAYIAAPFGAPDSIKRRNAMSASEVLQNKGFDVYEPWNYHVPDAWEYPNHIWGELVFESDVKAINEADVVVVLSYGRESTAGTNWEAGYAFGIGKTIIVVEMTDEIMSLMVSNGMYARVKALYGLTHYDFDTMPKLRTYTEQK